MCVFVCVCVCVGLGRTHTAPNSLSLHKPVPVVACVKSLLCWLVDETCLPCLVVKTLSREVY